MKYISGFISALELKNVIQNGMENQYLMIDLRDKSEYDEFHIKGSVNIEYVDFMRLQDYEDLIEKAMSGKTIVLCCERGGSSIYASRRLIDYIRKRQNEYEKKGIGISKDNSIVVKSLSGGIYGFRNLYM